MKLVSYIDLVKYLAEILNDHRECVAYALRCMDEDRCPLHMTDAAGLVDRAIEDFTWDNDLGEDFDLYNDYGKEPEDLFFDALEYLDKGRIDEAFTSNPYKTSPYDDKAEGNGVTQPLKNHVGLYDIRQRLWDVVANCRRGEVEIAYKQANRLYKLVDAMINQGLIVIK